MTVTDEVRSLDELALVANEAHTRASNIDEAIRAGEALIEAKAQVERGRWLRWLTDNFMGSQRTATDYMRLAANRQRAADSSSLRQGLAKLNGNRPHKARREPKPEGVLQHQASINLRSSEWDKFKRKGKERHGSAAAALGHLVRIDLEKDATRPSAIVSDCGIDDSFAEALEAIDERLDNFTRNRRDPTQRDAIRTMLTTYIERVSP
jgi:hypothetical protein